MIVTKEGCAPEEYKNSFSLQIYSANELHEIFSRNGFEIVSQYDLEGNIFVSDKSLTMLTVAKKT